ncbi:protein cramped-like, partial [Stegodyphus dumicola]|uniref:protein cramped-like n=1 Tax=Stegodyphus dumicola TaxID=202533 RepID=UPI0015B11024
MPTYNQVEGEDATDNDVESDGQQTIYTRHKPHLSRTTVKDAPETLENETVSGTNEKSIKLVNNQRSSNRLTKRLKRDTSPVDPSLKKSVATKPAAASIGSKTRRPWELWSVEDKNAFFEALCEYGKDFESIQSYIAQRSKKKGIAANMIKNKDQVRHFYYRTWHKISKFLEISEFVRKQTQELYGLINYAELRKKIGGCLNEKNRQKLNELVFSGVTTVKHKGKKLRIKTPVCRALKKLNNVSDTKEPETDKLPKDIFVEFRPHTNAAWLHVQNLAHNPRVRTKVCLQKRLKPVIEHLQRRWRPYRLKR